MTTQSCTECNELFPSQQSLNRHCWERHTKYSLCTSLDGSQFCLRRTHGLFHCLCQSSKQFQTCSGFQKHVRSGNCSKIAGISFESAIFREENDASDEDLDEKITSHVNRGTQVSIPSIDWTAIPTTSRSYSHAVLHAANAAEWREEEQQRLLTIMDSYCLRPISLTTEGVEENALTHEKHLKSLNEMQFQVSAMAPPTKRKRQDAMTSTEATSLYSSVISGPFCKRILSQPYVQMTTEIADFLNQDWLMHPQMRYACSRLLAGAILIDTASGKSVIVNAIEIFGRTRSLDSHRESFRIRSGTVPNSSLPPEMTRYPNIWPTTVSDMDGQKLIIGTKSFNALVTSSLRLDTTSEPEIGPTTRHFVLDSAQKSLDTQIFIKQTAWIAATTLASDQNASNITSYDIIYQLRQLRTRFHHTSTYLLCRSFNEPTDDVTTRPYTIFTLCDWDSGQDESGYRIGSKLFQLIGRSVIKGCNELQKDHVLALERKLNHETEMGKSFASMLALFHNDSSKIAIIGNGELNNCLEKIAILLSPSITKANESVKLAVLSSFAS